MNAYNRTISKYYNKNVYRSEPETHQPRSILNFIIYPEIILFILGIYINAVSIFFFISSEG